MPKETELEQALRHVIEGRRIVFRQRALIERERAAGHDTSLAEQLLEQFEWSQALFESDLRELRRKSK